MHDNTVSDFMSVQIVVLDEFILYVVQTLVGIVLADVTINVKY